ncbi:MAG: hypothetical protein QM831_04530 [Kofleriaceae bacterium]
MPRSLLVALALIGVVFAIESRVVIGGQTWDDTIYQTTIAPPRMAAAEQALHARFPAWWDGTGLGVPLAAEPTHGAATPAMWLASTPWRLDLTLMVHLVWFAIGVAMLARKKGSSDLGAMVAAVLIATSGLVMASALRGALPALAHVPWIALLAIRLSEAELRRDAARDAALLGLLIGLVGLAGNFTALIDVLAIAVILGRAKRTWRYLAAGCGAGVLIATAQWVPAFALSTAGSDGNGVAFWRLFELIVPGSFGSLDPAHGVSAMMSPGYPSLFVGAALIGLALIPKGFSPWAIGLLVLGILQRGLPSWFGGAETHLFVLFTFVAARAARGVDSFIDGEKRATIVLAITAGVATLVTFAMVALRDSGSGPDVDHVVFRSITLGGIGVALLVGAIALARLAPKLKFLALAFLVAPSLGSSTITAPTTDRFATPAWAAGIEHDRELAVDAMSRDAKAPRRIYRNAKLEKAGEPALHTALATLANDTPGRYGFASVRTDDPARSINDDAAWTASSHGGGELLERFGVGYAVLPGGVVEGEHLQELDPKSRWGVWSAARYPAAPPASVAFDWQWVTNDKDALATLFPAAGGRGIAAGAVLLKGSGDSPAAPGKYRATTCELVDWNPGAIDLACVATQAGYAVVSSSAAPGWSVEVDGQAKPWVSADVLRRAVAVPEGTHAVRWRYAMPGAGAARVIAIAGLLVCLLLGITSRRR